MTDHNPGEALVETYRSLHRSGVVVIVAAMLVLMVVAVLSTGTNTPQPANKLGVHLLLDDGRGRWPVETWPEHLRYARQVAGEWGYVTQLVRSDDLNPERWQVLMDLCAELHLTPILRLAGVYDREQGWWARPEPDADGGYAQLAQRYADFVTALDWPTAEHYVIVGNEPNHGGEWGGQPDPAAYARFLIDVAGALHAADPGARVLNAGFDPYAPHTGSQPFSDGRFYMDAESFMDAMVLAYPDVFSHIDLWASHAYPAGLAGPPWSQSYGRDLLNDAASPAQTATPDGVYNRGINGYAWELWKLSAYGVPPLPVMITETGWRHAETAYPNSLDAGEGYPDAATVSRYFDLALRGNAGRYPDMPDAGWTPWLADSRVIAVTPFALNGTPVEWGHTNWLVLDADGTVLDTYAVVGLLSELSTKKD